MRRLVALPLVLAAAASFAAPAVAQRMDSPLPYCFYTQEFGRTCIG